MLCCGKCKKGRWLACMTDAECGHPTVRGDMKLCPDCAKSKDACEACGEKLTPADPS